jgi:uncharacterized alkaline shock family protein YloU
MTTAGGAQRTLDVGSGVITALARSAADSVPGVAYLGRGGPRWRSRWAGASIKVWLDEDGVHVRIWLVAQAPISLPDLTRRVRAAVAGTMERQLDLIPADVTVVVDGVRA